MLQIPVNDKKGLTFARGLRAILRHDPDIILVGEIRDGETAGIAVQASLTGHVVLSSVHANDVFSVLERFLYMQVEPASLIAALNGVVAQRLVRQICPECGEDAPQPEAMPDAWQSERLPHTTAQQESLAKIQSQLRVQVPLDSQQPALESHITPSEYQLVGLVFDRLSQGGLRVEASRYQLDENAARPALLLDIPLQGEYLPLVESLEALARTLPLEIEQITLKRASPLESQLSVTVRLRLLKVTP